MGFVLKLLGLSGAQFWITVALVIGAAGSGAWLAWEIESGRAAKHEIASVKASLAEANREAKIAIDATKLADQITYDYGIQAAKAQREVEIRTQTLIREVTKFVPQNVDVATPIAVGFVRFYDAAASGSTDPASLPIATGQPNDAASDVKLSEIAAVSAANYGACYDNAVRLSKLQGWVQDIIKWSEVVRQKYEQ